MPASGDWQFEPAVDITGVPVEGVFHHIESAGRRNIAIAEGEIGVVWEDNRDGRPAIYLSRRMVGDSQVAQAQRLSGTGEAYEPTIVPFAAGFAIAWEEGGKIRAAYVQSEGLTDVINLGRGESTQAALVPGKQGELLALWSEQGDRDAKITAAMLALENGRLAPGVPFAADIKPFTGDQNYPSGAWHGNLGVFVIAWEDRRYENVVLFSAIGDGNVKFSLPMQVNGLRAPQSGQYGVASGAARIALTPFRGAVAATWADKRNFQFGYDIFASFAQTSGRFGQDMLVQDGFAEGYEQWHPAIASQADTLVVAWDDDRDGSSDIWISEYVDGQWSDDLALPGGFGPGAQTHPSIALDSRGGLHAVWVDRAQDNGPTRLRYVHGQRVP
ncbi:MAG: hypothetical protein OEQ18_04620 [Gammaproteobacteria bacterium]|nr:hypothetical protein [Gammaproteobacteria bacterium]